MLRFNWRVCVACVCGLVGMAGVDVISGVAGGLGHGISAFHVAQVAQAGVGQVSDWPMWRGPNQTGITTADGFDQTMNNGNPAVLWQTNIGNGYAGVSVADGKAYAAGWVDGQDTLYCFDAQTGKKIWSKTYPCERFNSMNAGGPGATPLVHDGLVYHVARDGRLMCFDAATGQPKWQKVFSQEFGTKPPSWGVTGSALIDHGHVLVDMGHVVAFDKKSGKQIWASKDYGIAYSTPVVFTLHGRRMIAAFPVAGLVVLDAETGKELAVYGWKTQYGVNAASPIISGNQIFISSGYGMGGTLLELTNSGLSMVWESRNMQNKMNSSVLIAGHLYGFNESKLTCMDWETGKVLWTQRGLGEGSLIAADDTLIVQTDSGEILTAKASPEGFEVIARVQATDERKVWTQPSLAQGRLYCRGSEGQLTCLDVSKGE